MWDNFLLLYHSFMKFLGTPQGEFFKISIEFIVLLIITYMILSEYRREKLRHLKFLSIAFGALTAEKFISWILLLNVVFGKYSSSILKGQAGIIISCAEIFSLILIANSFTMSAIKKERFFQKIKVQLIFLIIFFILIEISWNINKFFFNSKYNLGSAFIYLELFKIVILVYAIYLTIFNAWSGEKYRNTVIIAFLLYAITPILNILNQILFRTTVLRVVAHPFPLLAVLLFTRAIFLKLVDKATLKEKLLKTEAKYAHEKELSKMKDEFVSIISHELKTPLTSIKLYCSLLLDQKKGDLNDEQKEIIKIMNNESNRLSFLINDILDLAKLENKKIKLRIMKANLHGLVEESTLKNLAEKKNIEIKNLIPKNFMVEVDIERFKQVVINLFGNAVKYTDENGKIWFNSKSYRDHWEFSIRDNGCGIEKEKQKKLFEKFYTAEDYLTREKSGTGLGLAIAKQIVSLHKGSIKVRSKLGVGSTFSVIIPKNIAKL